MKPHKSHKQLRLLFPCPFPFIFYLYTAKSKTGGMDWGSALFYFPGSELLINRQASTMTLPVSSAGPHTCQNIPVWIPMPRLPLIVLVRTIWPIFGNSSSASLHRVVCIAWSAFIIIFACHISFWFSIIFYCFSFLIGLCLIACLRISEVKRIGYVL